MKILNTLIKESKNNYKIYHKSYTSAIDEVIRDCKSKGFYMNNEEVWNKISSGPKKPSDGVTNRFDFLLYDENGKPAKQMVHFQITGLSNSYELNMYYSGAKLSDYDFDEVEISK